MVYNNLKIDLNTNLAAFSCTDELSKKCDDNDTTLRLECSGYGGSTASKSNISRSYSRGQNSKTAPKDGSTLVLGLGPTPSYYSNDYCSSGISRNKKQADEDSVLELSLSYRSSNSKSALNPFSNHYSESFEANNGFGIHAFDEGSISSKRSGGYMPSLLLAPRISTVNKSLLQRCAIIPPGEQSDHGCPSESSVASESSTETSSDQQTVGKCKFAGCVKTAQGRSESCVTHGGRRRCIHPTGCSNAARGKWEFCIKHGGGKRCVVEGCVRSAEGQAGLCITHGGGKRCWFHGCTKGAQGSTNYCKAHGGGKRCVFSGCATGAEGNTQLCKAHGGGKRCLYEGGGICPKSVHSGTNFCVRHGGGRRCVEPGCTNSARGRTNSCVRHGGGKRCKFENCKNCAQGSTDFCKGHGGGRRCNWGGGGMCEKFARGKYGLCAAHGTMVTESDGGIGPRLFNGVVARSDNNSLSDVNVSFASRSIGWLEKPAKRRQLIPPQVLVPSSMKSRSFSSFTAGLTGDRKEGGGSGTNGTSGLVVPEGRVHGGSLLSLLGGNLRDAFIDGI
ncbi:hypothetical protein L1887_04472 [Cichorium endivia]|nr:hypothetical protein L1887_04472 [Cichorium endivia]